MPKSSNTKNTFPLGQEIVWTPNKKWIDESNLSAFIKTHNLKDYDDLLDRSLSDYAWFWDNVLKDLDIRFYKPYDKIVDMKRGIQFPQWCVGGQMNIVHNCLDKWQSGPTAAHEALRWEGEEGTVKSLTYSQLDKEVCRCANALRSLGLGRGDVIALYMPMIPELAIAFLAIIKIGGIILPLFSGYVFFCGNEDERSELWRTDRVANLIEVRDQQKFLKELQQIEQALQAGAPLIPHKYVKIGQQCRVIAGPLLGLQGIVVSTRGAMRLVLQVDMLGQAASVEIDIDMIEVAD